MAVSYLCFSYSGLRKNSCITVNIKRVNIRHKQNVEIHRLMKGYYNVTHVSESSGIFHRYVNNLREEKPQLRSGSGFKNIKRNN